MARSGSRCSLWRVKAKYFLCKKSSVLIVGAAKTQHKRTFLGINMKSGHLRTSLLTILTIKGREPNGDGALRGICALCDAIMTFPRRPYRSHARTECFTEMHSHVGLLFCVLDMTLAATSVLNPSPAGRRNYFSTRLAISELCPVEDLQPPTTITLTRNPRFTSVLGLEFMLSTAQSHLRLLLLLKE